MRRSSGTRRAQRRAGQRKCGFGRLFAIALGLAPLVAAADVAAQTKAQFFPQSSLPKRDNSQPLDPKGEFLMRADEVSYDRNNEIVTATGNVEISQGNRMLLADTISYNRRTETITASGNLVWMEPSGDVMFGEYAEIKDDLRDALVRDFRALLVDNSRLAANTARRTDGSKKEMTRGVFSPCDLCKDDPTKAPLWQIKGTRITHDEVGHDIEYRDATLEMWGVPVFYLPYFSHPDPSVSRRSGFLAPVVGTSSDLGLMFGMPYYGIIDETSDFTFEPRFYTEEGVLGAGEVRKRFTNGSLRLAGSLVDGREVDGTTVKDDRSLRGNIAGEGRIDFGDNWRGGFDLSRATDRTYLKRFKIGSDYLSKGTYSVPNQLTSDAFVEGFMGRSYANVSAFAFQSLRSIDRRDTIAKVHPSATYEFVGPTDRLGGRFQVDTNLLSLSREEGADSNRLASNTSYRLPIAGAFGDIWTITGSVRADAYSVNDVPLANAAVNTYDGTTGRLSPQIAVDWRYPLIRRFEGSSVVVEPRVQFVASPNGGNPQKIPNEDSLGFEFDDTNLFSLRRFAGYDRIDSGQRVDYGLTATWYRGNGGSISGFLGQSLRAQKDSTYQVGSGLEDNFSDIVGRLSVRPLEWLDLTYRFRWDHDGLQARREEVGATFFRWGGALSVSYINFDNRAADSTLPPAQQVTFSGVVPLFQYWSLFGMAIYDLDAKEMRQTRAGISYRDECFGMALTFEQDNVTDRELDKDVAILFRIGFKYLGDFGG